ncbi:MAG: MFS transporter [Chloroflexota bacterium]|nr:MFS transporter [Chloroflexota bacterium]
METVASQPLWRQGDFVKLWGAQTFAQIGAQITFVALPLTAILVLGATPMQMGLLTALEALPSLLVGLHAGAVVDRRRRRPVLLWTALGRALILAAVPLAWLAGILSIELLYAAVFFVGLLTLFFDVAYQAFLPVVVPPSRIVEANSKLELSRTAAEVAGPGLAGWLVQVVTAPLSILGTALTFLASALLLARLRVAEAVSTGPVAGGRLLGEIGDGLLVVFHDPRLRAIAGSRGVLGLFNAMLEAVFVLHIARSLGLSPALIGLVFAVGSIGFVIGSLLPSRLSVRFGLGPATIAAVALVGISDLLVSAAAGSLLVVVPLLIVAQFCFGVGFTVFNVNQASLRQDVVPVRLQGRASATIRFLAVGLAPIGALIGGALAEEIGLRPTLAVAAVGELGAAVWLWFSPIRSLMIMPEMVGDETVRDAGDLDAGDTASGDPGRS